MQPLASSDESQFQANVGLSRSISITLFDENNKEIHPEISVDQPIEIFIPRDPNIDIPPMKKQNVTSIKLNQTFYLQIIDFSKSLNNRNVTPSLHFEIHPAKLHLAYLFIFQFDDISPLNISINETDHWSLFCPHSRSIHSFNSHQNNLLTN